jgi:hypothetical protein
MCGIPGVGVGYPGYGINAREDAPSGTDEFQLRGQPPLMSGSVGTRNEDGTPIGLFQYTVEIGQRLPVVEVREPIGPNNTVHLFLGLFVNLGMEDHGKQEGQYHGYRLCVG